MSGRGRVLRKLSGKSKPSKNRSGRTRSAAPKGPDAEDCERTNALFKGIPVPTYAWKKSGEDFLLVDFNDAADASTHGRIGALVGKTASALYADGAPDAFTNPRSAIARARLYAPSIETVNDSWAGGRHASSVQAW